MIKLYELSAKDEAIRFSPYVWRVRLALLHKGLSFEGTPWHFTDKEAIAPAGSLTVPVIHDGDRWMKDSFDICVYLDDDYPEKPLMKEISQARFFSSWASRVVLLGLFPMIAADVWSILSEEDQVHFRGTREKYLKCTLEEARDKREEATPAFLNSLSPVRDVLKHTPFLSGGQAGWTDYVIASTFITARTVSDFDVIAEDKLLSDWRDRIFDLFDGHVRKAPTVHDWD